jgi:hypothetical protein
VPGARSVSTATLVTTVLAKLDPSADDLALAAELVARPSFDWVELLERSSSLWVHPLVARAALDPGGPLLPLVPSDIRRALAVAPLVARARWRQYEEGLESVLRACEVEGIALVLLKGAALGLTHYPPGTRILNDFDVWVSPDRFEDATRVLVDRGFRRVVVMGGTADENRRTMTGWTFVREGENVGASLAVDLHYRLQPSHASFTLDAGAAAERGEQGRYAGVPVRLFRPEDGVVHLATQIGNDFVVKLQTIADLHALLGGDLDFAALERAAHEATAAGPVALALRWARASGRGVPEGLVERLERSASGCGVATGVLFDLRAVDPSFALSTVSLLTLRGWYAPRGRARFRVLASVPATIAEQLRRAGAGRLRRYWLSARSVLLMGATWVLARAHATDGRGRFSANRWLWRRRNRRAAHEPV